MTTRTVQLGEEARRVLHGAFGKVRAQAEAVPVELPKGADPVDGPEEVLVLVLGPHGGFVSRRAVHGRPVDLRELQLRLASAEVAIEGFARRMAVESPPLSPTEASMLDAAGLMESEANRPGALEESQIAYEMLLHRSFTLAQAAKLLDVNPSRLRQRLGQRTLFGIKDGRSWRLPRFQFDAKKKLVRGIDKVLPRIRQDAHPLEVVTWFAIPHEDLVVGDNEEPVTPLDWLAGGRSPETVAELADEI